jgi:hypothetical protein
VATPVSLPIFEQGGVNQRSPAQAKIALFRSLFHGREDVYPQRFESRKTRRSGYSPACGNEWVRGICEKPFSCAFPFPKVDRCRHLIASKEILPFSNLRCTAFLAVSSASPTGSGSGGGTGLLIKTRKDMSSAPAAPG